MAADIFADTDAAFSDADITAIIAIFSISHICDSRH